MYQCADLITIKNPLQCSRGIDVEHNDRHIPIVAKGIGSLVKDPELLCHGFLEGNVLILNG